MIYETERLIVRHWKETDAEDLYEYAKEPEVSKFLKFKPYNSIDDANERIAKILAKYANNEIEVPYAIVLKEENKVIGSIDIEEYKTAAEGIVEVGYILSLAYQGKGYMTEALVGMFKHIKRTNFAKRIICKHDTLNTKSGDVMKRAGMTFEGVLRKAGNINNTHTRYDLALYSILDEEINLEDNKNLMSTKVTIYTDGACSGNPGIGGWGAILFHGNVKKEISGYEENTTNNKMELTAAIMALDKLKLPCEVDLYSDSAYLINAFNEGWITSWQINGFKNANKKPVANVELWQKLIEFNNTHKINWIKVKGHADNIYNNRCDELATGEISKHQNK